MLDAFDKILICGDISNDIIEYTKHNDKYDFYVGEYIPIGIPYYELIFEIKNNSICLIQPKWSYSGYKLIDEFKLELFKFTRANKLKTFL